MILYILSGLLGVSNMILWGLYGDLMMEPFSRMKVLRSIFFGFLYSLLLYLQNDQLPLFIVALNVITFERITTEIYKAFIRTEKQDKYLIPSDLNLKFPPPAKQLLGILLIVAIIAAFWFSEIRTNLYPALLLAGFAPAFGGMLKDAPYEGFELLKFFRSPLVSLLVGLSLLQLFPSIALNYFLFGVWGGERLISEFYKKIMKGNIPGKFKADTSHRRNEMWATQRVNLLVPYGLSWVLLIWLAVYSSKMI